MTWMRRNFIKAVGVKRIGEGIKIVDNIDSRQGHSIDSDGARQFVVAAPHIEARKGGDPGCPGGPEFDPWAFDSWAFKVSEFVTYPPALSIGCLTNNRTIWNDVRRLHGALGEAFSTMGLAPPLGSLGPRRNYITRSACGGGGAGASERAQPCDSRSCCCPQDSSFTDATSSNEEITGLRSPCPSLPIAVAKTLGVR